MGLHWVVDGEGGLKGCGERSWHGKEGLRMLVAHAVWLVPCCIGRKVFFRIREVFFRRCLENADASGVLVKSMLRFDNIRELSL